MINNLIDVVWLSYKKELSPRGYWDMQILEDIFSLEIWNPVLGYTFRHHTDFKEVNEGAVVILPARFQADCIDKLNEDISKLKWCVLILTGNEDDEFPCEKINHQNIKIWVQLPREKHKEYRKLPNGYPPQVKLLKELNPSKREKDWFFAGQVRDHVRRQLCVKYLKEIPNGDLVETDGFAKGLSHEEYYQRMVNSKIAICQSGAKVPDTFRLYEALEAGCIPIVDEVSVDICDFEGYFTYLFDEDVPFPVLRNYETLSEQIKENLENWKEKSNKIFAWWQNYKRNLAYRLHNDIREVSGIEPEKCLKDLITVLVSTSPIQSHPDTSIIEKTVESIREKLPENEIFIMIDGIRNEQEYLRENYQEYIRRLLWLCNHKWSNVLPIVFPEFRHQQGITKETIKMVNTPTILLKKDGAIE